MKVIPCEIVYHVALASRLHVPKYEKTTSRAPKNYGGGGGSKFNY